jgi:hypothetical protein
MRATRPHYRFISLNSTPPLALEVASVSMMGHHDGVGGRVEILHDRVGNILHQRLLLFLRAPL